MTEEVKTMSEVEEVKVETTDDGEPDYKSLYEETQAKLEKASKFESRFKKTAKELNELKGRDNEPGEVNIDEVVEKKFNEKMFFINDPIAKEFESEIKEIQKENGLSTEKAYRLFLADNKPELLVKQSSIGIDGVDRVEEKKSPKEQSYEELRPDSKKRG